MDAKKTGELIAALRHKRELNQSELAELIGVTNKAISRWETGRGYPDIETLPKLSDALNVTIPELLRGELVQQPDTEVNDQVPRTDNLVHDSSIETVCQYACEQTRRHKKKVIWLSVLLSAVICFSLFFYIITEVLPMFGEVIYSIVGSSDCQISRDYRCLVYLGDNYVSLPMGRYNCLTGERMVDECRVKGAGFVEKLFFGDTLYELKNIPNHEIVYLQTDYDCAISEYYVLETEYDRYLKILNDTECDRYYSCHYNESMYCWEQELDSELSDAINSLDYTIVAEEPDISCRLEVRLYDAKHMFFLEAGDLVRANDGYYWCPAEMSAHGYNYAGQYYPLKGFDDELSALFAE